MKNKQRLKLVSFIIIIALASPPVTAALYHVKRCVETEKTITDTSGCSKGQGCWQVRSIDGDCKDTGRYFLSFCDTPWDIPSENYFTPGTCSKDHNGDAVCIKIDFTQTRFRPLKATCKYR